MARRKKDGRRSVGIQGKSGYLYIVRSRTVMKDGEKTSEKKWIATGLADIPENIKRAEEMRENLLNRHENADLDRNITLAEYTNRYLAKKKREVADSTYASYYYRGEQIKAYFGPVKVRELSEHIIEGFLDSLFTERQVQPRTAKDTKVMLAGVVDQAVADGLIAYNPVKNVVLNKNLAAQVARDKTIDDEFFSYEEARYFLQKARNHELYELFYLTLFFGLRREEVLGLRWSAIDFSKQTMTINHTVTKGTVINRTNTTKTVASRREYPLTDEQIRLFHSLQKKEKENRKLFGRCYSDNDYIFKHPDGTLYYPDYPTKAFGKIIKATPELPQNITFHGLRSSCVSILVHEGKDVKSIQKWVGHSDLDTTLKIYAKVKDKAAKQELSEAMNRLITLDGTDNPVT